MRTMELAIAVHLPAVPPGRADEIGLALVFPRPMAERIVQPDVEADGLHL